MIRNRQLIENFEKIILSRDNSNYFKKLEIYEEMYKWAKFLQVFPLKNPMEGIEVDIKVAKILNGIQKNKA